MIKVTEPITFAEGFDEFLYTKNIEGCRPATIKHYKNSIHVFLLYHDENMRMDEITSSTVSNFFASSKIEASPRRLFVRTYERYGQSYIFSWTTAGQKNSKSKPQK